MPFWRKKRREKVLMIEVWRQEDGGLWYERLEGMEWWPGSVSTDLVGIDNAKYIIIKTVK